MTLIEGVGDEVTLFTAVVLVITLLAAAIHPRFIFSQRFLPQWTVQYFQLQRQEDDHRQENVMTDSQGDHVSSREQNVNGSAPVAEASGESVHSPTETEQQCVPGGSATVAADSETTDNVPDAESEQKSSVDSSEEEENRISDQDSAQQPPSEGAELNEGEVSQTAITVRLKYLNDTERLVTTEPTETVGNFKRCYFLQEMSNHKTVRLIFNGQLLRDDVTVEAYGIVNGTVVHVHISQAQNTQNSSSASSSSDLDISNLLWPLFSVILGIFWIFYIRYPEYFTVTSIVLLIAFSVSFLVVYVHLQVQLL